MFCVQNWMLNELLLITRPPSTPYPRVFLQGKISSHFLRFPFAVGTLTNINRHKLLKTLNIIYHEAQANFTLNMGDIIG